MNIEQVIERIRFVCDAVGGISEYARIARVHRQAVSEVLRGLRSPSAAVLAVAGIERSPCQFRLVGNQSQGSEKK